jgi:hypothetical protein
MHVRLIGTAVELTVPIGTSVLGRGNDCVLRVNDPRLSRHHARFQFDGENLSIEDAGSTNGVLVNGDRIQKPTGLKNGDEVVCGPCLFSVQSDATFRSSPSELMPQPESTPGRSTDTMEPIAGGPTPSQESDISKGRRLNASIAAAVGHSVETGSSKRLNPHEAAGGTTSALAANRVRRMLERQPVATATAPDHDTDHLTATEAQPEQAEQAEQAGKPCKDRTTGLIPDDYKQIEKIALQAEYTDQSISSKASAWRRGLAAALDCLQLLLAMALASLPLLIIGYVLGLERAGAIIDSGLPRLVEHPPQPAKAYDIVASLFASGGLHCAWTLIAQLYQRDDQQPFLSLFSCAAAALLAALLVLMLGLFSATVLRGGPLWHRWLGIEIVEHQSGYYLTWRRALARWVLFVLLIPASPIGLFLPRGLHDLCCGCRVRHRRR